MAESVVLLHNALEIEKELSPARQEDGKERIQAKSAAMDGRWGINLQCDRIFASRPS
jgi:hypothetical protein